MEDIDKTQQRKLSKANFNNTMPGDLYINTSNGKIMYQRMGIVAHVKKEGFCCFYNHMHQDKEELRKYIDNKKGKCAANHFFDTEPGLFFRKQKDGRLELISATSQFLEGLKILEGMYQDFIKKTP